MYAPLDLEIAAMMAGISKTRVSSVDDEELKKHCVTP
jgi:hypothetical protein